MIKITGLHKRYGDRTVLHIPAYTFEAGKRYAVIGANGSGKSTLLKILGGTLKPTDGAAVFKDGAKVAYMPQKSYGFDLSVEKNLSIVCKDKASVQAALAAFGLSKLRKKNASKLSGGETQRLCLARTMLTLHDVLLLDEPTAAMDILSAKRAEEVIQNTVAGKGATLVFATHSAQQAKKLADFVVFMHEGAILETVPAADFPAKAAMPETQAFLEYFGGAFAQPPQKETEV